MRCLICNKALSDRESTFKNSRKEYTDMCFECLQHIYENLDEDDNEPLDKDEEL